MKIDMYLPFMLQNKVCLERKLKMALPPSKHFLMEVCRLAETYGNVASVMAATSHRIEPLRASIVRGLLFYTRPFSKPQKKKSGGVRSGDLVGHRFFEINLSPK
jgi:hypothetical protein